MQFRHKQKNVLFAIESELMVKVVLCIQATITNLNIILTVVRVIFELSTLKSRPYGALEI